MQDFLNTYKPLIQRLAKTYAREHSESVSGENIAREIEIELTQVSALHAVALESFTSPISYIRRIVKHAAGRARRRHTLVEQVGAGDDLGAISRDLSTLDADLPDPPPSQVTSERIRSRARIVQLLTSLPTRSALIASMWLDDQCPPFEIASVLSLPESEVEMAIEIVKASATDIHSPPPPASSSGSSPPPPTREQELRDFAMRAADDDPPDAHLDAPLLALVHGGDLGEDLDDALIHLSRCALCRARLAQGGTATRSVVVVAIEAPRASERDLQKAADAANARLFERGGGRWAAVVDAAQATALAEDLERPESSLVSRVAIGTPIEVATRDEPTARGKRGLGHDLPIDSGTDASELQAWVQVGRKPSQQGALSGFSLGWLSFAVATIGASAGLAYYLATRP